MSKNKVALISVYDKTHLLEFASELAKLGFTIVSTGGTAKALSEAGLVVKKVSELTGFPEILDGRVKTLHPRIHGGILARRELREHLKEIDEHKITLIDLVVVNLYPFDQVIQKPEVTLLEALENIDIGGPTMIRAAAKNFQEVVVVVNPKRYDDLLKQYRENGDIDNELRLSLATEAFTHTAAYDTLIYNWLSRQQGGQETFPLRYYLPLKRRQILRYGENPQQKAAWYELTEEKPWQPLTTTGYQGKELSYNNINDLSAAYDLLCEFTRPTAVVIKHANPCGVASADTISQAFTRAYEADKVSIFGGIVALNRELDKDTALMMKEIFLEVVLAPAYSAEALEILLLKKDLRLIEIKTLNKSPTLEFKSVSGGVLVQDVDIEKIVSSGWKCVTMAKPGEAMLKDMEFALKVVKHTKSNAIVLAKDEQTVGVGAGQMNRIGSAGIALAQAGSKAKGSVLASDAFFPFADVVEIAKPAGVKGIVQPGGSLRDDLSIKACDDYGLVMMFCGHRHFKH